MVSKIPMRPMWTAVDHVYRLNNVVMDRDVLMHLTALTATVSQIFVKVSAVTGARRSTSTASLTFHTLNKYLYTFPFLRKDVPCPFCNENIFLILCNFESCPY
jgi:hypothetical protein